MSPQDPVLLYAEFTAVQGREGEVETLVMGLADQVRQEPGNVAFVVHRERDKPGQFFIYEEYVDEEAFRAHLSYEHGVVFNQALASLVVDGRATVTMLDRV
jgi:autoinducer 2-degrading protein